MMTWDTPEGIVLSLGGELDVAATPDVLAKVEALTEDGHLRIVLDMRHVTFCDCAGLSALLGAQRIAHNAGGWARLARIEPPALRIITLAGVATPLTGYPSAEAAFAAP
jgi:anti-sigma B factor antagonist